MKTLKLREDAMHANVAACFLITDESADADVLAFKQRRLVKAVNKATDTGYKQLDAKQKDHAAFKDMIGLLVENEIPASNFRSSKRVEPEQLTPYEEGKEMLKLGLPEPVQLILGKVQDDCTKEDFRIRDKANKYIGQRMDAIAKSLGRAYDRKQKAEDKKNGKPQALPQPKSDKSPAIKLNDADTAYRKAITDLESPAFDPVEALEMLDALKAFLSNK